jgi:hypothetical protein
MKNTSIRTLLDDLKISYKFALKNVISYVLAIIGVFIVTAILLVVVAIFVFVPLFFLLGGFEALTVFFESFGDAALIQGTGVMAGLVLLMLPFIAPFFVAIGALFGMGREIVESEGTSAEGVFTWYKRKFLPLAGGGLVMFLVVLGPILIGLLAGALIYGDTFLNLALLSTGPGNPILAAGVTLWLLVSTGLLSMMFPAIIDGNSVLESTKMSVRMSIRYFDRVFGFWLLTLGFILLLISPMFLITLATGSGFSVFVMAALGIYAIPMFLVVAFVSLPAITIGLTRVYMILSADDEEYIEDTEEDAGISFVGGL